MRRVGWLLTWEGVSGHPTPIGDEDMTKFHIGDMVSVVKDPSYTTGWTGKVIAVDQVDVVCFTLVEFVPDWDWQDPTMWYRDDEIRKL